MKKSDIVVMPQYFNRYIELVEEIDLIQSLEASLAILQDVEQIKTLFPLENKAYAVGKWTVKQLIQHIIDAERVFAYRALRFARKDKTVLSGYDENLYGETAMVSHRKFDEVYTELVMTRLSTISLFKSFTDEMLLQVGKTNEIEVSVLALGFAIAGHQKHHFNIIQERYI